MRKSDWILIPALLMSLGLAGCGSGGEEAPSESGTPAAGGTAEAGEPASNVTLSAVTPAANVPKPGPNAVTAPSGLVYEDLEPGEGDPAAAGQLVTVHYTGYLEDGSVFDSSVDRGQPFTLPLGQGQVIPGWDEGLTGMRAGGRRLLVIPPELGYGAQGFPPVIPPNATLTFEVEMIEMKDMPEVPEAPAEAGEYTTTDSGLQYAVLQAGDGAIAEAGDTVSVHYTGWLEDGKRFDSSISRGEPFSFTLGQGSVIPGWDEGVAGMQVGERRQLRVPPELGYGDEGTPTGSIPPNATLIFDVELIEVQ